MQRLIGHGRPRVRHDGLTHRFVDTPILHIVQHCPVYRLQFDCLDDSIVILQ